MGRTVAREARTIGKTGQYYPKGGKYRKRRGSSIGKGKTKTTETDHGKYHWGSRRYSKGIAWAIRDDLMARACCHKCVRLGHMSRSRRAQASRTGRSPGNSRDFGPYVFLHLDVDEGSINEDRRLNFVTFEDEATIEERKHLRPLD